MKRIHKRSTRTINGAVCTKVRASNRAKAHWRKLPAARKEEGGFFRKLKNTVGHALPHRVRRAITGVAQLGKSYDHDVPGHIRKRLRKNAKTLIMHGKGGHHVNVVGSPNDVRFGKRK